MLPPERLPFRSPLGPVYDAARELGIERPFYKIRGLGPAGAAIGCGRLVFDSTGIDADRGGRDIAQAILT
jgi:hypothetical protein